MKKYKRDRSAVFGTQLYQYLQVLFSWTANYAVLTRLFIQKDDLRSFEVCLYEAGSCEQSVIDSFCADSPPLECPFKGLE